MTMHIGKPQVDRVRVTALDPVTLRSKSVTVYGAKPEDVIDVLETALQTQKPHKRTATPSTA